MNKLFTIWHNALQYSETEVKELKRIEMMYYFVKVRFILTYIKGFFNFKINRAIPWVQDTTENKKVCTCPCMDLAFQYLSLLLLLRS